MVAGCVSMGTNYDVAAVDRLRVGMTKAEVISLLGQPNQVFTNSDGSERLVWVYSTGSMLGAAARSVGCYLMQVGASRMFRQTKSVIGRIVAGLAALVSATSATADDWTLACNYEQGVLVEIKYLAGDPSHQVAIVLNGTTDLLVHRAFVPAARLTAPGGYTFIVDRERTGVGNERNLIIRLNTDTMTSTLEAGNGVSWDYLSLRGTCAEK